MNPGSFHNLFVHAGLEDPPPPPLTLGKVKKAILAYFDEIGRIPGASDGNAYKWAGTQITWAGINARLIKGHDQLQGGSSLSQLCVEMGLRTPPTTLPQIKKAILAYFRKTGKIPARLTGCAEEWFGFPIHWKTIESRLNRGNGGLPKESPTSLQKLCTEMGLCTPPTTLPQIKKAILAYFKKTGKAPSHNEGCAKEWFGFPIYWITITSRMTRGHSISNLPPNGLSLYRLCLKMGLPPHPVSPVSGPLTLSRVKNIILTYFNEMGTPPTINSGDIPDLSLSWKTLDADLRQGLKGLPKGYSLARLCKEMKLETSSEALTLGQITKAILAYYNETGKIPVEISGNAFNWFGFCISWQTIGNKLRYGSKNIPGNTSLEKLGGELGLTSACITLSQIRKAVLEYARETGKLPTKACGSASRWFNFQITWKTIDNRLRNGSLRFSGGSSLAKLKKEMGLI